jgi:phage gpG-like protein
MKLNLPARPFLVLADDDTRRIVERMRRYLE